MADIEDNKTIKLYTFGCSHNLSDSEVMRHDLESAGYIVDTSNTPISSSSNYHAVIVNSCTVKNPSEQAIDTIKKKCDATSTPIVIAGCVPQADPKTCRCGKNCSVIGVDQLHHINDAIDKAVAGDGASFISRGPLVQISGHSRENPLIEILVTCTGCENACTYCKTMQARGRLRSYGVDALVNRVKDAVKEGVTEIRLTGEDIGAYGKDIGLTFPFMLRKLIEAAQGKAL
ncbi:Threonylcarbamoyladenosine tRNA methylthiotransferase [Entamoeba marina]